MLVGIDLTTWGINMSRRENSSYPNYFVRIRSRCGSGCGHHMKKVGIPLGVESTRWVGIGSSWYSQHNHELLAMGIPAAGVRPSTLGLVGPLNFWFGLVSSILGFFRFKPMMGLGPIWKLGHIGLLMLLGLGLESWAQWGKDKMEFYPEWWKIKIGFQPWVMKQLLIRYYLMMLAQGFFESAVRAFTWDIHQLEVSLFAVLVGRRHKCRPTKICL